MGEASAQQQGGSVMAFLFASGDPRGEPKLTLEQDEFGNGSGMYGARSVLDLSARRKLMP